MPYEILIMPGGDAVGNPPMSSVGYTDVGNDNWKGEYDFLSFYIRIPPVVMKKKFGLLSVEECWSQNWP